MAGTLFVMACKSHEGPAVAVCCDKLPSGHDVWTEGALSYIFVEFTIGSYSAIELRQPPKQNHVLVN